MGRRAAGDHHPRARRVDLRAGVSWTAFMIIIVIAGGVGTIKGPVVGAIVGYVPQQWLSRYGACYEGEG